jgi:hypothetical protein
MVTAISVILETIRDKRNIWTHYETAPLSLYNRRHHLANNSVKIYPGMETRALSEYKMKVVRKKV